MVSEKEFRAEYKRRIQEQVEGRSSDYSSFVDELKEVPKSLYEKACAFSEKMNVKPDPKTAESISQTASFANLRVTPTGVYSFALLAPLIFIILGTAIAMFVPKKMFLLVLIFGGGLGAIIPLLRMPFYMAETYRLRASNQMVLSVFYLVTYLRHTSNLERAVEFAADHLAPPLSNEFRKVLWDVESGNFGSVEESLEHFLSSWKESNGEFVDAIHLVQGSLLEGSEKRRIETLEKALNLILDETYEKMLHFAHNLQSPITTLHMLGIILPILGLVILPLVLAFLASDVAWYNFMILYNLFLPVVVSLLGFKIMSKRPSGYGESPVDSREVERARSRRVHFGKLDTHISPKVFGATVGILLFVLGLMPLLLHGFGFEDFGWGDDDELSPCGFDQCLLGYREKDGVESGPFAITSTLLSLLIPLGLGLGFGLYYSFKSGNVMQIFEKSHKLENEFSSSLFQLGNKLGDNIPAESATLKVALSMPDTSSGTFFKIVATNIQKLGMGIKDAIYDPVVGAMVYYPSSLIDSSMRVLIESAKKGPLIASNALINISRYIKEMHKVEERLKDLMAEVISSMKSQITFLTPVISAIVVGITSMISSIIGTLGASVGDLAQDLQSGAAGFSPQTLASFFSGSLPPFYFQVMVGIYVVQITAILTVLVNSIQNGSDPVRRDYLLGKNLIQATLTYVILTAIVLILFESIVGNIIQLN